MCSDRSGFLPNCPSISCYVLGQFLIFDRVYLSKMCWVVGVVAIESNIDVYFDDTITVSYTIGKI